MIECVAPMKIDVLEYYRNKAIVDPTRRFFLNNVPLTMDEKITQEIWHKVDSVSKKHHLANETKV